MMSACGLDARTDSRNLAANIPLVILCLRTTLRHHASRIRLPYLLMCGLMTGDGSDITSLSTVAQTIWREWSRS